MYKTNFRGHNTIWGGGTKNNWRPLPPVATGLLQ